MIRQQGSNCTRQMKEIKCVYSSESGFVVNHHDPVQPLGASGHCPYVRDSNQCLSTIDKVTLPHGDYFLEQAA